MGDMKLRMMRKQMEFRKGILAKEWEHAQMMMKLRHMGEELATYRRLKVPHAVSSGPHLVGKETNFLFVKIFIIFFITIGKRVAHAFPFGVHVGISSF